MNIESTLAHSKNLDSNRLVKPSICVLVLVFGLSGCSLFETYEISPLIDTHYSKQSWQKTKQSLQQIKQWRLIGKINIRTPADSATAAIHKWIQIDDNFTLDLSSTFFGLGATKLVGSSQFLTIIEPGEEPLSSDQPDQLIEEALGFPLPISNLPTWIKALPIPDKQFEIEFNEQGLPKVLIQNQWKLEFSKYILENDLPLPTKIKLQRDHTRIILAIKKWTLL